MKISLDCNISLSKKLRSIIGENGSVTLMANGLNEGKGFCKLILQSDNMKNIEQGKMPKELQGETSIMITPISLTEANPPNNSSEFIGTIFSTTEKNTGERTVVDRIAATTAPDQDHVPHAIIAQEEIQTPEPFKETVNNQGYKDFVANLQELMVEVEKAKSKTADIDLSAITDPRLRAVEMERKESMESIDKNAYIVNEKAGVLTINDLDITLALNAPYDLSNISAKRIAASSELKGLLKSGFIKFIDPSQIDSYVAKAEQAYQTHGLEVFDKHDEAEANMGNYDSPATGATSIHSSNVQPENGMEVTGSDVDNPTEEEKMMLDLTRNMTKSNTGTGVHSSRHGSS